jgi:hypothetical protein
MDVIFIVIQEVQKAYIRTARPNMPQTCESSFLNTRNENSSWMLSSHGRVKERDIPKTVQA